MTSPTVTIPAVDLSAYQDASSDSQTRQAAAQALVRACHELGFCTITGHGLGAGEVREAFAWMQRLFTLPLADKMKAPHPAAAKPHRGYSGVGIEKVYSRDESAAAAAGSDKPQRTITDYKESYEIGSDENLDQGNIWLPEDVLPGFHAWGVGLYWKLDEVANRILTAFADGLKLQEGVERGKVMQMNGRQGNQLRLLHYPAVDKARLQQNLVARMPAHTDWGGFTLLFQDETGGLELQDPRTKEWVYAKPTPGALVLNISDFFERLTNGYLKSANHRVTLPSGGNADVLPERYSMPYFVAPVPETVVGCLDTFVSAENPAKYETMAYEQYGSWRERYSY